MCSGFFSPTANIGPPVSGCYCFAVIKTVATDVFRSIILNQMKNRWANAFDFQSYSISFPPTFSQRTIHRILFIDGCNAWSLCFASLYLCIENWCYKETTLSEVNYMCNIENIKNCHRIGLITLRRVSVHARVCIMYACAFVMRCHSLKQRSMYIDNPFSAYMPGSFFLLMCLCVQRMNKTKSKWRNTKVHSTKYYLIQFASFQNECVNRGEIKWSQCGLIRWIKKKHSPLSLLYGIAMSNLSFNILSARQNRTLKMNPLIWSNIRNCIELIISKAEWAVSTGALTHILIYFQFMKMKTSNMRRHIVQETIAVTWKCDQHMHTHSVHNHPFSVSRLSFPSGIQSNHSTSTQLPF